MPGFEFNRFPDLEANDSLAALAEGFKCGICLQVLDKAVDTRCGHTFCHECLNQWLSKRQTIKECPECRQTLATRKRSRNETNDNNAVIIGGNVLVDKSRRINEVIGKLKITCDYEWNGCPEVCPLESLSTHLKTCQYQICQTCGLTVRLTPNDHNCIEGLKIKDKEWQKKCDLLTKETKELEIKLKLCEQKSLHFETKCKQMETLNKELEIKLKESDEKVLNLELKCSRPKSLPQPSPKSKNLNPSLFTSLFNEKIMFTLNANYVMFGECMASVGSIKFTETCINLENVALNDNEMSDLLIIIPYFNIDYMCVCFDPSLPLVCIKTIGIIENTLALNSSLFKDQFDVYSKDPRKQMIIIELKEAITETFVKPLRESCSINNKFEYKTIDLKRGQIIQKWAKKRIN